MKTSKSAVAISSGPLPCPVNAWYRATKHRDTETTAMNDRDDGDLEYVARSGATMAP
jgi:hypothetical protein